MAATPRSLSRMNRLPASCPAGCAVRTVAPSFVSTSREDAQRIGNTTECHTFAWSQIVAVHLKRDRTLSRKSELRKVVPDQHAASLAQPLRVRDQPSHCLP